MDIKPGKNPVKVKICGITNIKDAEASIRLGADALGFIFADSPRRISPREAQKIAVALGPFTTLVGVFVNFPVQRVADIASTCRLDAVQLHGEEPPEFCKKLTPYKVIKTFRMGELFSAAKPQKYDVDAFLFDTGGHGWGGTGITWDWGKLPVNKIKKPFIVSGGLTPANVKKAVDTLSPYAVDVASGVESRPGTKDHLLVERFIKNAKS